MSAGHFVLLAFLSKIYMFLLAALALCYPLPERITDLNDIMTIKRRSSYWNVQYSILELTFPFIPTHCCSPGAGAKGLPLDGAI